MRKVKRYMRQPLRGLKMLREFLAPPALTSQVSAHGIAPTVIRLRPLWLHSSGFTCTVDCYS